MRLLAALTCCVFVFVGCTDPGSEPSDASPNPAPAPTTTGDESTTAPTDPQSEPTESTQSTQPVEPVEPPHPVSLPALQQKEYDGARLRLGTEVYSTSTQRQYEVTYRGSGLTISGRIAIPEGKGPFPAIVLAHGYIDPVYYVNGQGMTREREWFANHGYVALHVDYRNHAGSDDTDVGEADLRMGYTEDVINAVLALRDWDGPVADDQMAIGGRSMGGGVVYNALVAQPGLVDAGVVWAPVSSDAVDNYDRWIAHDPGREDLVNMIDRRYGLPRDNPEFWDGISARTYFDQVTEPVLIHHGTLDDTCPLRWSRETARLMERDGVDVTLAEYEGEGHAFGPQFFASMERTGRYLRQQVR